MHGDSPSPGATRRPLPASGARWKPPKRCTSTPMTHTLETRDLTIRFGGHVAVNRVSCIFRPGELTAIVGPNGAGKTTYFNLISGQLRPTDGTILFDGA